MLYESKEKIENEYSTLKRKYDYELEKINEKRIKIDESIKTFERIKKEIKDFCDKNDEELKSDKEKVLISRIEFKKSECFYKTCSCDRGYYKGFLSVFYNGDYEVTSEIKKYLETLAELKYDRIYKVENLNTTDDEYYCDREIYLVRNKK